MKLSNLLKCLQYVHFPTEEYIIHVDKEYLSSVSTIQIVIFHPFYIYLLSFVVCSRWSTSQHNISNSYKCIVSEGLNVPIPDYNKYFPLFPYDSAGIHAAISMPGSCQNCNFHTSLNLSSCLLFSNFSYWSCLLRNCYPSMTNSHLHLWLICLIQYLLN